jgi:hypothetical protein
MQPGYLLIGVSYTLRRVSASLFPIVAERTTTRAVSTICHSAAAAARKFSDGFSKAYGVIAA